MHLLLLLLISPMPKPSEQQVHSELETKISEPSLKISRKNSTKIALFSGIPTITAAVILEFYWLSLSY